MSSKNQSGILSFDEIAFPREPNVGIVVNRITGFTLVIIIGFDPNIIKVGNLAIGVVQSRFFMKVTLWIKTKSRTNGRQWSLV
jgi:hypothetical protein